VIKRLRKDTRGATLVMTAMAMSALFLFAGLALDFGRAYVLKAQLQTAVDAAALAGALQVIPMAELSINRRRAVETECWDPVSGTYYDCLDWRDTSSVRVTGTQWELIAQKKWKQAAGDSCTWPFRCTGYKTVREWLVLPNSTVPTAENTFHQNERWPSGGALSARVEGLSVTVNHARAEVTASARMTTPTTFLKLVGIQELSFERKGTATPVKR